MSLSWGQHEKNKMGSEMDEDTVGYCISLFLATEDRKPARSTYSVVCLVQTLQKVKNYQDSMGVKNVPWYSINVPNFVLLLSHLNKKIKKNSFLLDPYDHYDMIYGQQG